MENLRKRRNDMKKVLNWFKEFLQGIWFAIELFVLIGFSLFGTLFCIALAIGVLALICVAIFSPFIIIAYII